MREPGLTAIGFLLTALSLTATTSPVSGWTANYVSGAQRPVAGDRTLATFLAVQPETGNVVASCPAQLARPGRGG